MLHSEQVVTLGHIASGLVDEGLELVSYNYTRVPIHIATKNYVMIIVSKYFAYILL